MPDYMITYVLSNLGSADATYPYAYLASEKIYRILEGDLTVEPQIPALTGIHGGLDRLSPDSSFTFKLILTGGDAVGKTSLVKRFVEGAFQEDYRATIGLNVLVHSFKYLQYEIKLSLFDMAGQSYFKRVRQNYYEGTHAALIVFDLTRKETIAQVRQWKAELDRHVPNIPLCLLGTNVI